MRFEQNFKPSKNVAFHAIFCHSHLLNLIRFQLHMQKNLIRTDSLKVAVDLCFRQRELDIFVLSFSSLTVSSCLLIGGQGFSLCWLTLWWDVQDRKRQVCTAEVFWGKPTRSQNNVCVQTQQLTGRLTLKLWHTISQHFSPFTLRNISCLKWFHIML